VGTGTTTLFTHCPTYFHPLVAFVPILVPLSVMTMSLAALSIISAEIF
jgi:hypothetical protein